MNTEIETTEAITMRHSTMETLLKEHPARAQLPGQTWDKQELLEDFNVVAFCAPFVVAIRKSDGVKGSLEFTHSPRFYYGWTPHID